jgi:hypothetical protein
MPIINDQVCPEKKGELVWRGGEEQKQTNHWPNFISTAPYVFLVTGQSVMNYHAETADFTSKLQYG